MIGLRVSPNPLRPTFSSPPPAPFWSNDRPTNASSAVQDALRHVLDIEPHVEHAHPVICAHLNCNGANFRTIASGSSIVQCTAWQVQGTQLLSRWESTQIAGHDLSRPRVPRWMIPSRHLTSKSGHLPDFKSIVIGPLDATILGRYNVHIESDSFTRWAGFSSSKSPSRQRHLQPKLGHAPPISELRVQHPIHHSAFLSRWHSLRTLETQYSLRDVIRISKSDVDATLHPKAWYVVTSRALKPPA